MQKRLDPETGVIKPFENVFMFEFGIFFREGASIFVTFQAYFFSTDLI